MLGLLGAVAFYLVFPRGLLEDYVYPRASPEIWYQVAAVCAAAVLMTGIYAVASPAARAWRVAAGVGALLGLLAAAPAQLALLAVVRSNPWRNLAIVVWTAGSWALAGLTISWLLRGGSTQEH